jgi:hypothetical protein
MQSRAPRARRDPQPDATFGTAKAQNQITLTALAHPFEMTPLQLPGQLGYDAVQNQVVHLYSSPE